MTRKELQSSVQDILKDADHPLKDARAIVAFCCHTRKEELLSHPEASTRPREQARARKIAQQRAKGTPLAYILGERDFYGRTFSVNQHTLIPRPETEVLVELAKKATKPNTRFIDLGTGSGAIALTLAAETGNQALAIDVSRKALRVAKRNARKLNVGDLVTFRHGSLMDAVKPKDISTNGEIIITANLPYLTEAMLTESPSTSFANELVHEPALALVSDSNDGLDLYRTLFAQLDACRTMLPEDVTVLIELLPTQRKAAEALIKKHFPNAHIQAHKDLSDRYRIVEAQI